MRMARGYLKWSAKQLAQAAGIGVATVNRMEECEGLPNAKGSIIEAVYTVLQHALDERGLMLIFDGDHGPGICMKYPIT